MIRNKRKIKGVSRSLSLNIGPTEIGRGCGGTVFTTCLLWNEGKLVSYCYKVVCLPDKHEIENDVKIPFVT